MLKFEEDHKELRGINKRLQLIKDKIEEYGLLKKGIVLAIGLSIGLFEVAADEWVYHMRRDPNWALYDERSPEYVEDYDYRADTTFSFVIEKAGSTITINGVRCYRDGELFDFTSPITEASTAYSNWIIETNQGDQICVNGSEVKIVTGANHCEKAQELAESITQENGVAVNYNTARYVGINSTDPTTTTAIIFENDQTVLVDLAEDYDINAISPDSNTIELKTIDGESLIVNSSSVVFIKTPSSNKNAKNFAAVLVGPKGSITQYADLENKDILDEYDPSDDDGSKTL